MAVHQPEPPMNSSFALRYGEHSDVVVGKIGLSSGDIAGLHQTGVVA